jgi:hypothetical protein
VDFLLLVATFVGFSCLVVPLLIVIAFAVFNREDDRAAVRRGRAPGVTRPGG